MTTEAKLLLTTAALATLSALAAVAAITLTNGCNQELVPIVNPTPSAPCGNGAWYACPDNGCCYRDEECTSDHRCRYVGEGPTWGATRDGGAAVRPEISPEEARRRDKR